MAPRGGTPRAVAAAARTLAAVAAATVVAAAASAAGGGGDGGWADAYVGWQRAWAQAAGPILTINTAGAVYDHGDTIVIHGNVRVVVDDTPVLVTVFHTNSEGKPVKRIHIAQVGVAQDGSFTDIIYTSSEAWPAGEYTVEAHYSVHGSVTTSFTITSPDTPLEATDSYEVDAGSSGTFDVPYTIVGGKMGSMRINPDTLGMSVFIEAGGRGGFLTLELERKSIDARTAGCEGGDELFIILVDGAQTPYEKISDMSDRRIVKVPFREGDGHVEIIGTCVVPEFGLAAAAGALAAAVGAAAALSRRGPLAGGWGGGLLPRA